MSKNFKAWPKDWPKSLNYPDLPVYAMLDQIASRVPNRISIIFSSMELTFRELKELSERFATALAEMGVTKGDRVAIHLPNCPQFAIAYYGLLRIGAVFTPISPLLAPGEVQFQLKDSGAETIISLDMIFPLIKDILPQTNIKRTITTSIADCYNAIIAPLKPVGKIEIPDTIDMIDLLKKYEPRVPEVAIDVENDLAHIAYTGGTTGISKGIMHTHRNVWADVLQTNCWIGGCQVEIKDGVLSEVYPPGVDPKKDRLTAQNNETVLVVAPWFHVLGYVCYLNCQILAGATMIVFPRFDPKEFLDALVKYRATGMGGAPQLFIPLINHPDFDSYDLSSIKYATSGAAPLAVPILEKLINAFSGVVIEGYGLTEGTGVVTLNPPDSSSIRPGSVGIPLPDTECRVVDMETGSELSSGSEGELCVKGPQVMKGYWNNPEETANVLKDGWLHTGDVAIEDDDGYFYITDRIKDMIIYKGYNIYPREVEEVIFAHPAVQQCAIVGKADPEAGEIPVVCVELKHGHKATKEEIMEHANTKIAHYKKVRDVIFFDQLPVSLTGKVLKKDLRKMLSA